MEHVPMRTKPKAKRCRPAKAKWAAFDGDHPSAQRIKNILGNTDIDLSKIFYVIDTLCDVVIALLDSRDFAGYQLSYANGSMSEEGYQEIVSKYLGQYRKITDDDLALKTCVLNGLLPPDRVDSDVISVSFKVELPQASKALGLAEQSNYALLMSSRHLPVNPSDEQRR